MLKRTLVAFVAVACLVSPAFAKNTKKTTKKATATTANGSLADEFTTGVFGDDPPCKPTGDGGDPDLNYLKNSDAPIAGPFTAMRIADIIADLDAVNEEESVPISIEGFLADAPQNPKHEGPESCNCHSATNLDYHVSIVENASDNQLANRRSVAMVVEISPRMLPKHPN
jgi:hypothetical protein